MTARRRTVAPGPGQLALPLGTPWPAAVRQGWRRSWRRRRIVNVPTRGLL